MMEVVTSMLISKKDLLNETNISYGQLYRWKREGLIPEEWFIKQSSFTGQETFFPKDKILNRIKAIQDLKEKYTLEELAKILSPEVAERNFTVSDLHLIDEIEKGLIPCFCNTFNKDVFTFIEILILISISKCKALLDLSLAQVEHLCQGISQNITELKQTDYMFVVMNQHGEFLIFLYPEKADILFDNRLTNIFQIRLNDISSMIKIKYKKSFNFKLDDNSNETFGLLKEVLQ